MIIHRILVQDIGYGQKIFKGTFIINTDNKHCIYTTKKESNQPIKNRASDRL